MKNNTKRQDILEAYASLVVALGLEGASIGAVARYMGINQSLIFHYFENKEDLLCQLSQMVAEKCIESYEKICRKASEATPDSFEQFAGDVLEIHRKRSKVISPKLYFSLMYLLPRNKAVYRSFVHLGDTAAQRIAGRLEFFRAAGVIDAGDCVMAARTLLCLADGILCYGGLVDKEEYGMFVEAQRNLFYTQVGFVRQNGR